MLYDVSQLRRLGAFCADAEQRGWIAPSGGIPRLRELAERKIIPCVYVDGFRHFELGNVDLIASILGMTRSDKEIAA
jgi:hypothetical protein